PGRFQRADRTRPAQPDLQADAAGQERRRDQAVPGRALFRLHPVRPAAETRHLAALVRPAADPARWPRRGVDGDPQAQARRGWGNNGRRDRRRRGRLVKIAFIVLAALMVALALAVLLVPLVRQGRRSGRSRGVFVLSLGIALVLPLGTGLLYLLVGTPAALNGVSAQARAAISLPQAIAELREHLAQQPDDQQGWMLLAQTHSMLRPDHKIEGRARSLLQRAVQLHPDNQRGLWLLGISDFQRGDYRAAAATWRLLQPQLEPGSNVAKSVAEQIAVA